MNTAQDQKRDDHSALNSLFIVHYSLFLRGVWRSILRRAFIFATAFFPPAALAAWVPSQPIIPCGGDDCDFNQLVLLGGNLVDFAFYISIPLAAIAFVYAGYLFVTAVGDPGKVKKAGEIFQKVALGFIIVLSAWLVVSVFVKTLVTTPGFSLLG